MTRSMIATLLAAALCVACGGGGKETKPTADAEGKGGPAGSDDAIKFDINGDDVPDVFKYYGTVDGQDVMVRKEWDINFDGQIDIWQHYKANGKLDFESFDMDFDGKVDVHRYFGEDDRLVRKEVDLEFDERPDLFKFYDDGNLIRIERDSDSDGRVDYWEYYRDGKLRRVGVDEDGDGEPDADKWKETKEG